MSSSTRGVKRDRFAYSEGERVLCYEPDPNKAKVLYDSKVLECRVAKDGKGKKIGAEYVIHFYGWSSSWDRIVAESEVLADNQENRLRQKSLAEEAAQHLKFNKKLKLNKIPAIIKEAVLGTNSSQDDEEEDEEADDDEENSRGRGGKVLTDFTESSLVDEDEDDQLELLNTPSERSLSDKSVSDNNSERDSLEERSSTDTRVVDWVPLPDDLKMILEKDYLDVMISNIVYQLPFKTNVKKILEDFKKAVDGKKFAEWVPNYTPRTGVTRAACNNPQPFPELPLLVDEFVNSTEIYFDTICQSNLLYNKAEEDIFNMLAIAGRTPSEICGLVQLLRFLVALPDFIAASTSMPDKTVKILVTMFDCFTHFLSRNHSKLH